QGSSENVAVGRNVTMTTLVIAVELRRNRLWIYGHTGWRIEDFKFIGESQVVSIRRQTIRDRALRNLGGAEWFDHLVFSRHLANPRIWFNWHCLSPHWMVKICLSKR